MKNTFDIAQMRARLETLPAAESSAYARQMWLHTLDCLESGRHDSSGAVPYVPVAPETLGCTLSENDRLLDVGCLGGHGLFDFGWRRAAAGLPLPRMTGMDIAFGLPVRELYGEACEFVAGSAEELPFANETFRLVIARLLLPYVRIDAALAEISRVVADDGLVYLQSHGPGYYRQQLLRSLKAPRTAFYYLRPLVSGWILRGTGRQPRSSHWQEAALSDRMLEKLAAQHGLHAVWRGTDKARPLMVFGRRK